MPWPTSRLREDGLKVQCLEKGSAVGGIWHWNCYPGARVDTPYPVYQFTDKELWSDWTWSEKYPSWKEIRQYFEYVENKWQLRKHIRFNAIVNSAKFDEKDCKWTITCEDGSQTRCRWFIPALGYGSKNYIPSFKGLSSFQGLCFHSSSWPQGGIDLKNKRVAVIGTGASGVQIIQEIAKDVQHMTVFQRTPNTPLPMRQESLSKTFQDMQKASGTLEETLQRVKYNTFGGFDLEPIGRKFAADLPSQRREVYEEMWQKGGFYPVAAGYSELYTDKDANDEMWKFWAEKQGPRIRDPRIRAIVAPAEPQYAFGAKRAPLEQTYFEVYNQENVDIIDIQRSPIVEFTETGITTEKGHIGFDVIILATGFDAITGGLTSIDITGTDGLTLKERWQDEGIYTNLGMACNSYPNMFFLYGPQAPAALSNGPPCVELQGEWVGNLIQDMKKMGKTRVEATRAAGVAWRNSTNDMWNGLIWSTATTWYSGSNIPGKKIEALNWYCLDLFLEEAPTNSVFRVGGLRNYISTLNECRDKGYEGFTLE